MVKVAQDLGGWDVLRHAILIAVDRLVRVDHEPGRLLDGSRAHVDAVVARREPHLLVGVADLQSLVSAGPRVGVPTQASGAVPVTSTRRTPRIPC